MRILGILALGAALAGCAQYEEYQAAQNQAAYQAIQQSDDAQCQSYGAQPGTPPYINCRTQLASQRSAEEAQKRAVVGAYLLNRR
jgi:hypothetical protein